MKVVGGPDEDFGLRQPEARPSSQNVMPLEREQCIAPSFEIRRKVLVETGRALTLYLDFATTSLLCF